MSIILLSFLACTNDKNVSNENETINQEEDTLLSEDTDGSGTLEIEQLNSFEVTSSVWAQDQGKTYIYLSNVPELGQKITDFNVALSDLFTMFSDHPEAGCADYVDIAAELVRTSNELYYNGADYLVMVIPGEAAVGQYTVEGDVQVQVQYNTGNAWAAYEQWDPNGQIADYCGLPQGAMPSTMDFYDVASGTIEIQAMDQGLTGSFMGSSEATGQTTASFEAVEAIETH